MHCEKGYEAQCVRVGTVMKCVFIQIIEGSIKVTPKIRKPIFKRLEYSMRQDVDCGFVLMLAKIEHSPC